MGQYYPIHLHPNPKVFDFAVRHYHSTMAMRVRDQGKHWCFTVNNPTMGDDDLPTKLSLADFGSRVVGAVYQVERGHETHRTHLQGYVEFSSNQRLTAVKGLPYAPFRTAHWELRKGTRDECIQYVTKEDTRVDGPYFLGEFPDLRPGERTDLYDIAKMCQETADVKAVCDAFPKGALLYFNNIQRMCALYAKVSALDDFEPYGWQRSVIDMVARPAHKRHIYFYVDPLGGTGKSVLVDALERNYNGVSLSGKVADMAYIIATRSAGLPDVVVFDVPRVMAEKVDHLLSFAEKVKDGTVLSTKYESKVVKYPSGRRPHVLFFSNAIIHSVDGVSRLSRDRVKVVELTEADQHPDVNPENVPVPGHADALRFM